MGELKKFGFGYIEFGFLFLFLILSDLISVLIEVVRVIFFFGLILFKIVKLDIIFGKF